VTTRGSFVVVLALTVSAAVLPAGVSAQALTNRGFVDLRGVFFPEDAPNDPTNAVADFLVRDELFAKPASWLQLAAGGEVRANSHDQVEDEWRVDFSDRSIRRPRVSIRRLAATIARGPFTIDLGKQFIRWGTTDIVTPTDRFAPRDFLTVFDSEFLPVTGARAAVRFGEHSLEAVWAPRLTPSRIPLLDQRWTVLPEQAAGLPIVDVQNIPDGSQAGVRWHYTGAALETSLSFFDGFNHLPNVAIEPDPERAALRVMRLYPAIRSYGADFAKPLPWVTVKAEAAYFTSTTPGTDEYVLYVVQLERQTGEWSIVGGYAGEAVTVRRAAFSFAPDRGVSRSLVGRASYTIDPNRSVAFESAVRQNGDGMYVKAEYSQARGQHWRATVAGTLIRGEPSDFIGEFRLNSNASIALRYSF
jgi:hypothetical protein